MHLQRERGFTLPELLVTIGIISLLLAASWGRLQSVLRQHRLTGATNQITTHLRLARERSVAEGNDYIVTFRLASNDYQIWDDEGNDGVAGPADVRTVYAVPDGIQLRSASFFAANRVILQADGTANATGSVQIGNGENSRTINVLASTGKVTVTSP
jgi:prepilin-type N-terminal cleavage/methylation domain-containing protein